MSEKSVTFVPRYVRICARDNKIRTMNYSLRRLSSLLLFFSSTCLHAFDGTVDHLLEGTMIYSGTESKAVLAFDDDASTSYSTNAATFGWVGLDLGDPHVITRVGFTSVSTSQGADRMLLSLFEGANSPDFMDAVPLYLISSKPAKGVYTTADVDVSRGFRYVRYVGAANSYCNIAELKFYGHEGEGDDSRFYQITNLPTLSVHVRDNILPTVRGEDFESQSLLIYEGGTMTQDYPVLFRVRGNYSSTHENKAFRIKYNDGKSHHMMRGGSNEAPAKCKKWVLINSYRDKTLMRNPVAWAMSKRAEMQWTPWSQIVDLVVNGCYWGTYTLADAVSVDKARIDITEMYEWDTEGEALTGGYYVEVDNNAAREPYWFNSSHGNPITVHDPDEDVIQPVQFQYIQNAWNNMENLVFGPDYADRENGMRSVLDMETFVRHILTSEFNGNTDMLCQVFLYKERGDDHFYVGPVWDADLALENDQTTYPANERMDWTYKVRDTGNWTQFVARVLSDPTAFAHMQEMWAKLRKAGRFEPSDVAADVDSLRDEVRASAGLNFIRWPYLTQWLSLNPEVPGSWEAEVDRVRNFVRDRVAWMDQMLSYGTVRQENGVYQIATGLDLCNFARIVNENGETDAKAALIADIDMTGYNDEFQPIGTISKAFAGSIDGRGHTISGLHVSGEEAVGLIGYAATCTLKNIVFDATCSAQGTANVGMLVGYVRNGAVTISGIENHGSVTASDSNAGGLAGAGRILGTFTISNSCNTGTVTAPTAAGALISPSAGKVTATNCYNVGTVGGAVEGKEFAFATKGTVVENCWDYTSMQTNNMSPAQVDNGWLCYRLNGETSGGTWRQNLDNGREHDAWPVLRSSAGRVYEKEGRFTNINADAVKYRYYNLVITGLQGGGSGAMQFAEFGLLDETLGEIEGLSVYAGPDGYNEAEGWEMSADGNVYSKYCGSFHGRASFLFDAGSEVDAFGYRIFTANDTNQYPERNPSSWRLYGCNTQLYDPYDAQWTLIDERESDQTLQATSYQPYDFYIPHTLTSLVLDRHAALLLPGEELRLAATYLPLSMQNLKLQWASSDETVATVDAQGSVEAVGPGKADIVVSAPNVSTLRDTCTVSVVRELPGHRYYQLAISAIADGSIIQFAEFDLLDRNGKEVTPLTCYYGTGTWIKDHDHADLFDDNTATKYCAVFDTTLYIYIDAGQPVTLTGYRITTAADTQSFPGRNPSAWTLSGSNTQSREPGDACWTLLDQREADTTLGAVNNTPFDFYFSYPKPKPGDVNGDGEVNAADYTALKLWIVGRSVPEFVPEAADLNADGKVNAQDVVLLARMLRQGD